MNLSDNLKKIRKDNNLSQEQLAEKLGVSRQSVSKWESGLAYPEMDKVLQICQMFNLNVDELLNQNIKEVKENKESKANVNKFIDDFLNFITKTIDMFTSLKFKEKVKCLFEQIIVGFILTIIFTIIGGLSAFLLSSIFSILPNALYYNLSGIAWTFYIVFSVVAGVAILLHIFKIRYLDYYVIVKSDEEDIDKLNNDIKNSKEETVKYESKEKVYLEKKKEKIIIRDPNHSQYKFIKGILKCVIFFIKLCEVGISLMFAFSLIFFVVSLVLSFLIVKTGILFLGAFITIISCIVINLIILYILYNFIFSKKVKKNKVALIFVSSIILIGLGTGFMTISIKDFNYISDINYKDFVTEEKVIDMRNDLIIDENYYGRIEYVESDNSNIRIVCKHSKYYKFSLNNYYKENIMFINFYETDNSIMDRLRDSLEDLNNKEIVDYSKSKIYIYTTKENIDKLKNNLKNYNEQERQNRIDKEIERYEEEISDLLNKQEEQQETIYNLEQQITEKNEKITELENTIKNYIDYINN